VGELPEASTNWTVSDTLPDVVFVTNVAVGAIVVETAEMYPVLVKVSLPAAFVAVRVTV
jgi:hypothetical protein